MDIFYLLYDKNDNRRDQKFFKVEEKFFKTGRRRMKKMLLTIFIPLLIFIPTIKTLSQESTEQEVKYADKPYQLRPAYGVFFNLGLNMHNVGFRKLPGIPSCCPREYGQGQGFGYMFGFIYNIPLTGSMELSLRPYYQALNGSMSLDESITLSDPNGKPVNGVFEHQIDANIASVGIAPMLGFRLMDQLTVNAGLRLGTLMKKDFTYKEVIKDPSYGNFPDVQSRTRNEYTGAIPDASAIDVALMGGISYDLPLNKSYTWFLAPEAFVSVGIVPITTDWTLNTIYGGVAIKYAPREIIPPKLPPLPPPEPAYPEPPQPPEAVAGINAVSVDSAGHESSATTIVIQEFITRKVTPLFNYIFFDENSAEIRPRYKRNMNMTEKERNSYSVNELFGLNAMQVYYQILNIVGRRMIAYPIANLTLNGYNSDEGQEKGNRPLSLRRAQAIKDYLVNEWGIDPERITVSGENLPPIPSNTTDPMGIAENRRVEMLSDFPKIFEPLNVEDKIVHTNPPLLRFKPRVKTDVGIKSWKIVTAQASVGQLKVFEGNGPLPAVVEWDLKHEKQFAPQFNEPLRYQLEVVDNDNKTIKSDIEEIPVQAITEQTKTLLLITGEIKNDTQFDQYTLISFGFDKANLTKEHMPIVAQAKSLINTQVPGEKRTYNIEITGRTDITGDANRNVILSKRRADATADALGVSKSLAKGLGEKDPLYDNKTPEGRFLNRNVIINVETVIEIENNE